MTKVKMEEKNAVNIDATWRDRLDKEVTETFTAVGLKPARKNMEFWYKTESNVIFSGHN